MPRPLRTMPMLEAAQRETRPLVLPRDTLVHDYSDAARAALEQVLACATNTCDKRAFATWLLGAYASATLRVGRVDPVGAPSSGQPVLANMQLEGVLGRAVRALSSALRECFASAKEPAFVRDMLDSGLVLVARDRFGLGYIAVDRPRVPLRERLLALLAADYLNRPRDYVDGSLDAFWPSRSGAPQSGIRARHVPDRRTTLRGGVGT